MAKWTPIWIVTTTTTCGEAFSELFDTFAGAHRLTMGSHGCQPDSPLNR